MATKPQTTKPLTRLQRIAAVSPRYAALLERHASLRVREEELIAEIKPLSEQQSRSQISWVSQTPKPKPKPVVRHAGATALLGDLLPEQPPEEINPPPQRPSWPGEDRLRELGAESEAISEALKLLVPELTNARKKYSKAVATQRGDEYRTIAESVVDASIAFGNAILAHYEFITAQRLDGVAYREFRPLNLEWFGNIEPSSPLMRVIHDAVEMNHVGAGKIPDWKMPADIQLFSGGN